jgi:Asp-tRNA(Asn)/Glu-tRNA(Gln) amidotransferase A subunit family amidase
MLAPTEPHLLTATQVHGLLKNNTITVEEYARSLLGRIEERDSTVKAWAYLSKLSPSCYHAIDENIY